MDRAYLVRLYDASMAEFPWFASHDTGVWAIALVLSVLGGVYSHYGYWIAALFLLAAFVEAATRRARWMWPQLPKRGEPVEVVELEFGPAGLVVS